MTWSRVWFQFSIRKQFCCHSEFTPNK